MWLEEHRAHIEKLVQIYIEFLRPGLTMLDKNGK